MMDGIEIRRVTEEEWPAVLDVSRIAFGEEYTDEDDASFKGAFPFERSLGAFDGGRLVGTTAVYGLQLTVPGGGSLPMGGLTWVGVLPTHRRRGILRTMMQRQFTDMLERGEVVSGLGASESTIYGRYGYGPATSAISFEVERAFGQFATPPDGPPSDPGRVILLDAREAADQLPGLYETLRLMQPGATDRPAWLWRSHLADPPHNRYGSGRMHHVKHENASGVADGYASYRLRENWVKETAALEVKVVELLAADAPAYRSLWHYLLNTDLSRTISCYRGRADEPLRWLLADPRRFNVTALYDNLWLRLLDAPRALVARTYGSAGRLALEVSDPFLSPAVRTFHLQVERANEPGAECALTSAPGDLALDMDVLGMVYLGGVSFATLAAAGRVRELTPGAVDRADLMFASGTAPYCSTDF
jgi:predicted acetyltransferase